MNRSHASRPLALILAAIMIFCVVAMTSIATPVTVFADSRDSGSSGGGGGGGGGSSSSGSGMIGGSGSNSINFSAIPIGQKYSGGSLNVGGTTSGSSSVSVSNATKATATSVASAVQQAVATGADKASARVSFANVKELSTDVLSSVAKAAVSAGKGMEVSVVVNADTVDKNGAVTARMSVDVAVALQNGQDINTSIEVGSESKTNTAVKEHLEKYFDNNVEVVTFGQKGSFGMNVPVAVKVDLSNLDADNLHFVSYDVATNQYTEVQTEYTVDKNGYVHFTTPVGNSIAITDAPLKAK